MSVNDSIDPGFLFHVEDEALRFRVRDSTPKSREVETVGDRRFRFSGIRQGYRPEKDETKYSDGDDEDVSLIQPGSAGWKLVAREDEEVKSSIDRHEVELKVMSTNPDGSNVSHSHHNSQSKRDFASVEKENVTSVSSWESLKTILSDPVTGAFMNDAMILPCGHSFGAGGLKEVKRMKACFTCSQPTLEGSEKPNLSLRIVVHSFCQEEESDHIHSLKRRKERSDQHKKSFYIPKSTETPKSSRGIQFPFSIGDQIIIEGNKRTPPRFVGRKAVIMTQCLNGWYVVKTVDNAESIKLQHCSLAKISENSPAKVTVAEMAPSWL